MASSKQRRDGRSEADSAGGGQKRGFSKMLAAALAATGTTQLELSRRCGITPQAMSRYVSGQRSPSIDVVMDICDALDMDLGDFARLGYVRVEAEVAPETARAAERALARSGATLDDAFEAFLRALAERDAKRRGDA